MYDERTNLSQQVTANLRQFFGEKLYTTAVPRNVRLAEAPSHGQPALVYDPRSRGAESYIKLAKEFMDHNMPKPETVEHSLAEEQIASQQAS